MLNYKTWLKDTFVQEKLEREGVIWMDSEDIFDNSPQEEIEAYLTRAGWNVEQAKQLYGGAN